MRAVLRRLCEMAIVGGISLLLLEGVLRVHNPVELGLRGTQIVLPVNKHLLFTNPLQTSRLDRVIEVRYNSLGFRGPEPPFDADAAVRVVTIGGSTTHSARQSNGKAWPDLVAAALAIRFPGFWLNNAGMEGHSTFGHRFLLEQAIIPLQPDYALFLVGLNDRGLETERVFDGQARISDNPWHRRLIARSEALSTALMLWRQARAQRVGLMHWEFDLESTPRLDPEREDRASALRPHREFYVKAYRSRLRELVAMCRSAGIEPVLITQPALWGDGVDPSTSIPLSSLDVGGLSGSLAWAILELYNDETRTLAAEQGVFLVDLARELTKDSRYFYDWVHYTNEGAAQIAVIVAQRFGDYLAERSHGSARAPRSSHAH